MRTRAAIAGASTISGLVRMLATTTSNVPGGSASGAAKRDLDAVGARVVGAGAQRLRIDVDAAHARRAELRRGDREDAGAAAVVEQRLAAAHVRAQPFEAQARGRMRAGAEREAGIEAQHERPRIGHHGPRRHDPEIRRDLDRAELRLRGAHPVLLGDRKRSRAAGTGSPSPAATAASAARQSRVGAKSATTRDVAHDSDAGMPGSP